MGFADLICPSLQLPVVLPLPSGEGWGEGNSDCHFTTHFAFRLHPSSFPHSPCLQSSILLSPITPSLHFAQVSFYPLTPVPAISVN